MAELSISHILQGRVLRQAIIYFHVLDLDHITDLSCGVDLRPSWQERPTIEIAGASARKRECSTGSLRCCRRKGARNSRRR